LCLSVYEKFYEDYLLNNINLQATHINYKIVSDDRTDYQ
jgi:hypothetical protein